ncbi:MAG TPA: DUF1501 domain-containing protein [Bryobacteraceae bacterium]|nr:DUF1501 domain-containing protein [Bryobacteraceae bacterium]
MKDRFGKDWSKLSGTQFWKRPQLSRRLFFKHAASAVGGYFLLPGRPMESIAKAAVSPIGTAKNCIFILMQGGPSHTDTFDLKVGSWTPAFMNPTSYGGMMFPQGLMPKIADQMDSVALLRSVKSWAAVHGLGQTWIQIGRNPVSGLSKIAPHIGSVVSLELGPTSKDRSLPAFVSLNTGTGPGNGYLAPEHSPFYVNPGGGGLGNTVHPGGVAAFDRRFNLLLDLDADVRDSNALGPAINEMATFNLSARKLMYNSDVDKIFSFDQNTRNLYGNTAFGNACVTARNLLRAKMGTRFIQITLGSWDHHQNIYQPNANLQALSRQFDNGLGQLIADLKQDGLLDETLIIAMGEFGRTVGNPNTTVGRDHFLQQAVLMAGARIRGGRVIGATDSAGLATADPGWSGDRDIKAEDIEATIYSALGIDWTTVRHDDPLGRGFEYVPKTGSFEYSPVHELWS